MHVDVDWSWVRRGAWEECRERGSEDPGCVDGECFEEWLRNVSWST